MPAPLPARNFARLLLLGGATLALIGALHQLHTLPGTASAPQRVERLLEKDLTPAPAKPSAFAAEQTMSSSALMARWEPLILQASHRFKVPAEWLRAVMRQESGGRTMLAENLPIVSSTGAMGIMQVMPGTYTEMATQYGLGTDPYNPRDNINAGAGYLKWLHGKYGYPAMFAAYNDGPGNLDAFLTQGRDLPDETHNYVNGISKMLGQPANQLDRLATARFTRPDGTPIEIDTRSVSAVRAPFPGEYAPGVLSVLSLGKTRQGVREGVAAVTATLRAHGAKI